MTSGKPARWVAKGFKQKLGIDYESVFAPTGRIETVRILLAITSIYRMKTTKFDITTFFLTGDIDMDVYVSQPEGYEEVPMGALPSESPHDYVCKLKRSLYGTKQAAQLSNKRLTAKLELCGFRQSMSETQVFIKGSIKSGKCVIILLWVDDGFCVYKDDDFFEHTITMLKKMYDMSFEKSPKSFLSIQIEYDQNGIHIHQTGYVEQILEKFNMTNCNPVPTPVSKSQVQNLPNMEVLLKEKGPEVFPGRTAIGMIGWLVQLTRPDLCQAFNYVCRHTQVANNSSQVFGLIKHCLRYLKGNKSLGLSYPYSTDDREGNELEIKVLVDSDLAGAADKKSTTGYLVYINHRLVMYRTKKQSTVATSTCNAELNGISEGAKAAQWLRGLLFTDLGLPIQTPTQIYNDNQPAISLCENPVSHATTRHFALKQAALRELKKRNVISVHHMAGECLAADMLTKALDRVRFNKLLKLMLNPDAECESHDDKTTKAYSSNTMGDGPTGGTRRISTSAIINSPKPRTSMTEPVPRKGPAKPAIAKVEDSVKESMRKLIHAAGTQRKANAVTKSVLQIDNMANVLLVQTCIQHGRLVDISDEKQNPNSGICYECHINAINEEAISKKGTNPMETAEAMTKLTRNIYLVHPVTYKSSKKGAPETSKIVIHWYTTGNGETVKELASKSVHDLISTCRICNENDEFKVAREIYRQQKKRSMHSSSSSDDDRTKFMKTAVQHVQQLNAENQKMTEHAQRAMLKMVTEGHRIAKDEDTIPCINGIILPTTTPIYDNAEQLLRKVAEVITKEQLQIANEKNVITNLKHIIEVILHNKNTTPEQKLYKLLEVFGSFQNDLGGLKRHNIHHLPMERVVKPLMDTLTRQLNPSTKRMLQEALNNSDGPRPPPLPFTYLDAVDLSRTTSDDHSYFESGSCSSSSSEHGDRRMTPPPLPRSMIPPPLPMEVWGSEEQTTTVTKPNISMEMFDEEATIPFQEYGAPPMTPVNIVTTNDEESNDEGELPSMPDDVLIVMNQEALQDLTIRPINDAKKKGSKE